jgi:hypothetical protein
VSTRIIPDDDIDCMLPAFPADDGYEGERARRVVDLLFFDLSTVTGSIGTAPSKVFKMHPMRSCALSTDDRIEGLWQRGCFRRGTARVHDEDRFFYYEGDVSEGLYEG